MSTVERTCARVCVIIAALLLVAGGASAETLSSRGFSPMPARAGQTNSLKIKFVRYTGGASGRMVVDLRNDSRKSTTFQPKGLFFVPQMDPERAPQRLGAAGPFEVDQGQGWVLHQKISVRPGKTVRVKLQVFCLDSHRSSPSVSQRFRIAKKLLPKSIRKTIVAGAAKTYRKYKGRLAAPAASEVQGKVWRTRNKKWIKIEGERKNEKSSARHGNSRPQHRRYKRQIQRQQLAR